MCSPSLRAICSKSPWAPECVLVAQRMHEAVRSVWLWSVRAGFSWLGNRGSQLARTFWPAAVRVWFAGGLEWWNTRIPSLLLTNEYQQFKGHAALGTQSEGWPDTVRTLHGRVGCHSYWGVYAALVARWAWEGQLPGGHTSRALHTRMVGRQLRAMT